MPYTSTRTVRTITSDGRGPPRVETRTYTNGQEEDDGGSSGGMDFGGFRSKFGNMKISFGGGGDDGGRKGGYSSGGYKSHSTQRPQVCGRASRKCKKNPFSGLEKQSYDEIVSRCKAEGILFEDPEFEAEDKSIFFSQPPPRPFEWKRPTEICDTPYYVTEGASRFDVQQGELGDCWLLAAVASLTCNHHLLDRVIIPDQNFTGSNYCGVFRFNIWHQGDWMEVVVDDRLPTYYDKLVFMHSADATEFWSALLEKAYAKLNGSYECLKGGSTSEAMEDFTAGVTESVDLQKAPPNLLNIMMKAHARGSLMGCSIEADPNQLEAILSNGLVMGHAYSVTNVKLVEIQTPKTSGKIPLVRVRNPWGNESEWKGAWSDSSAEWKYIPDEEKRSLGLTFDDDGEFWMSFQDWQTNFQKLEICNLGPDSLHEDEAAQGKIRWEATAEMGEWIPRVNAGGCRNYLETFQTNPQYRVTLTDPDDDEDDLCTMLVGLLQKDRRKKRKEGLDMLTIGYVIYKLKEDGSCSGPCDQRFFKYNASIAKSPSFINMREICGRHKLSPGQYVIIPSTFEPNQAGEFLLRIFTEKAGSTTELDEGTGMIENQTRQYEQQFGSTQQPDPYADREPPPLGFDMMDKTDYKRVDPPRPNYDAFGPLPPAPQVCPPGPPQGYQPYPYNQGQDQGYAPPYGAGAGAPYQGGAGYQPMPDPNYNPQAGYQPQPNQYYPTPGYDAAGYQSSPYGQPAPPGAGYQPSPYDAGSAGYQQPPTQQPSQYFPMPYQTAPGYQAQPGAPGAYGAPQGQYPGQGQYPTPTAPYNPSQQPQYPYGQGEAMEQAQTGPLCMAEPGVIYQPFSQPARPVSFHGYPADKLPSNDNRFSGFFGNPQFQISGGDGFNVFMPTYVAGSAAAPPSRLQGQSSRHQSEAGGMRSKPARPPPPQPIIRSYQDAIDFLVEQFKKEGPPVTEEDQAQGQALRETFKRIAGEDMEIDAYELREILNTVFTKEFEFDGFSVDVCRSMVAMHDGDLSGKLGFDEFKMLWQDLRKWKAVFKQFDKDHSGHLSTYELRSAFRASGFKLSNRSLSAIIMRFSNKAGEIEFDDFVLCAIRLKTMIESFKSLDPDNQGVAAYDIDSFIQTTMYS